jgi:hypothetical protein
MKEKITCDECKKTTPLAEAIDLWCGINDKDYCFQCQKKLKIGWYKEFD